METTVLGFTRLRLNLPLEKSELPLFCFRLQLEFDSVSRVKKEKNLL